MIDRVTGYPMLDKPRTSKIIAHVELAKKTLVEWDGKGMKLNGVIDIDIMFEIHVIAHGIYSLS